MSHRSTSLGRRPAGVDAPSRMAWPPVRRLARSVPPHVEHARRGVLLVAAGTTQRSSRAPDATSADRAARARAASSESKLLCPQPLLVAGQGHGDLATLGGVLVLARSRTRASAALRLPASGIGRPTAPGARRRHRASFLELLALDPPGRPNEHRVEGGCLRRIDTNTARAVQYSRWRATAGRASAPGEVGRAGRRDGKACASCKRRFGARRAAAGRARSSRRRTQSPPAPQLP